MHTYHTHKRNKRAYTIVKIVSYFFNLVFIFWVGFVMFWIGSRSASVKAQNYYDKGVEDGKSAQLIQDEGLYKYCANYKDMFISIEDK